MSAVLYYNKRAPGVPYFQPLQSPPAGTALIPQPDGKPLPKLFTPVKIRDLTLPNRIIVSPMCQYSAENGFLTPWHLAHYGGMIIRGPGLTIVEATAVTPEGRITPEDAGIWADEHIKGHKDLVEFAHSQNQKIAIQLAHAGRKASTVAPWLSFKAVASNIIGGWTDKIVGPSALPFDDNSPVPHELSADKDIPAIVKAFTQAAVRAVQAGYDAVEIHSAHGYLLSEFISPLSNKRTDTYGGSFENRIRLLVEVVDAMRAVMPNGMPLFVRINGSDRVKQEYGVWTVEEAAQLAQILGEHGVDLIDVSSGAVVPSSAMNALTIPQSELSAHIRKHLARPPLVGAVGGIKTGTVAEQYLEEGRADVIFVGRAFQKHPGLVWAFADELGTSIYVSRQIEWGFVSVQNLTVAGSGCGC
ncbi:NADH:flavin oxidoreductase 1 [Fistulina hepatica ATCC 64428]|uniref:NADH:flavin oxidoreductase 1 n=1 Tax=Fistulina hepatica ATCC 64428 TaxID=1128425 RepID=A0A0D7AIS3_9AGAR|nr:NADH:flavin oxidoreductase 1 [Fistulina hepatica ATCC 64428]